MFLHMVGHLSVFVRYSEPIPTYIPGWGGGGVGVYFDWCIIILLYVFAFIFLVITGKSSNQSSSSKFSKVLVFEVLIII